MNAAAALDHAGVAGADLGALAAQWERLGFTLTPRARHSGQLAPGGEVAPLGTGNRCAMLRRGYVELIAIVDPAAPDRGLGAMIARHPGLHILALSMDDEEANLDRLRRAGIDLPGVAYLERPVDDCLDRPEGDANPHGPRARFARLPLPDAPEGRLQLVRHLTPEALWQPRFLDHPNRAEALEAVIMVSASPAEGAARLSRLAGRALAPDPAGGYALALDGGQVRVVPPEALERVLPGVAIPCLPCIAGLAIRTGDGTAALRRIARGLAVRDVGDGLMIAPREAGGAALLFS